MPKLSNGLNYFDLQTDINSDMRVKLFRAEFGIKGFGVWIELLIQVYGDEGYFLKWDEDTNLLFADEAGISATLADGVVGGLVRRGLFNKSVFNSFNILTSKHIQEKYFNAIKRRESEIEVKKEYLLVSKDKIPDNVNIKSLNVNIKTDNVSKKTQRREEKSKEEKSRVDTNAREVNAFVGMELEQLHKLNAPLQANQLEKLRADFSDDTVKDVLIAMENHKKLTKKYTSAYLTALNWCKRRSEGINGETRIVTYKQMLDMIDSGKYSESNFQIRDDKKDAEGYPMRELCTS